MLRKADAVQGIRSAKLPIQQHVKLAGAQILTVNQVFAILLDFMHEGSWASAFAKTIPERKRGQLAAEQQDGDTGAGDSTAERPSEPCTAVQPADAVQPAEGVSAPAHVEEQRQG